MAIDNHGENDIRLMLAVRAGDIDAFEALHNRYQDKVLRFFYGLTGAPQESSDLCQETFLRIWRIRKRYAATGAFPAYLFAVARTVWMEHRRKCARLWKWEAPATETADRGAEQAGPGHEDSMMAAELRAHIFAALDHLPEEQRMVFVMRSIDGLPLEDIAVALDCPINTVRSRKLLAVKRLRFLLRELYNEWTGSAAENEV